MNGGTVLDVTGGNKTKNEKNCDYSIVDLVTLDINGGVISRGLYGIDNRNSAFGADVRKKKTVNLMKIIRSERLMFPLTVQAYIRSAALLPMHMQKMWM